MCICVYAYTNTRIHTHTHTHTHTHAGSHRLGSAGVVEGIAASMLAFPESVDLQVCVCMIKRVCVRDREIEGGHR